MHMIEAIKMLFGSNHHPPVTPSWRQIIRSVLEENTQRLIQIQWQV